MCYVEELVENYWNMYFNFKNIVFYEIILFYKGNE